MWRAVPFLLLVALLAAGCTVRLSARLPAGDGDLAVVALVESDPAARYTVLAHSGLLRVADGGAPLEARAEAGGMLRIVVFLYDGEALAAAIVQGMDSATLPEAVEVVLSSEGLPAAGRSDWVSNGFVPEDGVAVEVREAGSDSTLVGVRDRVAAQLAFRVVWPEGGVVDGGGMDGGVSDGGASDSGVLDGGVLDGGTADGGVTDSGSPPDCGTMVLVPTGDFVMGSDTGEGGSDEEPEHVVTLSAYCIDATEVTNVEWRACVTAGGCTPPASADSATRTDYYTDPAYDDYPVVNVDWYQAGEYCAWLGKRLLTEAEWEKAARGGCEVVAPTTCGAEDERLYPWGDTAATCTLANYSGCVLDTDDVGARPSGDSPYGLHDMAGNVREWVADWYDDGYYSTCAGGCTDPTGPASGTLRVMRGCGYQNPAIDMRVAVRRSGSPENWQNDRGLRCARDL